MKILILCLICFQSIFGAEIKYKSLKIIKNIAFFKKEKFTGKAITSSGIIIPYKDGLIHGYLRVYNNKNLIHIERYKKGKKDGIQKRWDYNSGVLILSFSRENGEFDGAFKEWYLNGKLKILSYFIKGKIISPSYFFHKNGIIKFVKIYKKNKLSEVIHFNEKGLPIEEELYKKGQLHYKYTFKAGKKLLVYDYKKDDDFYDLDKKEKGDKFLDDGQEEEDQFYDDDDKIDKD